MPLTMPQSGVPEASKYVTNPGWYHFIVTQVEVNPLNHNSGQLIQGVRVTAEVVAGTDLSQVNKIHRETFLDGQPHHKDGGEFASSRQIRCLAALGILPRVNPGEQFEPDWTAGRGRDFVAKISAGSDERFKQIDGLHIYAPTDASVKDVPKCDKVLQMRAKLDQGGQQTAAPQPQQAQPQPPAQSNPDSVDLSDL